MYEIKESLVLLPRTELISQLSASLGEIKATDLIKEAANRLNFFSTSFSQMQALAILESISLQPGLVGIVARCAKARVILRYNKK